MNVDLVRRLFTGLVTDLSRGAFLDLAGRRVEIEFRMPDGALRRFHMDGRGALRFGESDGSKNPDATVALDFGIAQHLSLATSSVEDVQIAVDAGMVTVSGDVRLLGRISLGAMVAGAAREKDALGGARPVRS